MAICLQRRWVLRNYRERRQERDEGSFLRVAGYSGERRTYCCKTLCTWCPSTNQRSTGSNFILLPNTSATTNRTAKTPAMDLTTKLKVPMEGDSSWSTARAIMVKMKNDTAALDMAHPLNVVGLLIFLFRTPSAVSDPH